ncbi:cell division protein FtsI [Microbacterium sp. Root53]|uniref:peptidoglycan D,D-transpeptidase FtsI family protein n=1 Tax=Microbacterium sp. Root53 TaxID=1736553 RepID=UPI0006FF2433|nr:penicillin-binding protein 2 [Microbacterium sp. Root53]KQY98762.1 cell division protein FtsI [Microbacterium sp. Root53]
MNPIAKRSARRRTMVAAALVLIVLAGFVVRLIDIQVVHADDHIADSQRTGNMTGSEKLWGTRGTIVDADGVVLASSTMRYDLAIDPALVGDIERTREDGTEYTQTWDEQADLIAQVSGTSADEIKRIVADTLEADPDARWAQLAKNLSTAQYQALRELELPYLVYDPKPSRTYPNGAVAGNLIGFESNDGDPLAGIELAQDSCLEAKDGEVTFAKGGADGIRIPGSEQVTPAVDGGQVQLTLDSDLQWYMEQMIAEETQNQRAVAGTVTVVDVQTGQIRAAAQYPSMDPNDVLASDPTYRGSLIFGTVFEPGSTFKPITAAMLLEEGVATPLSTTTAAGWEQFPNGARVGDSFQHPTYTYTLAGALIDSSNVALSKFGELLPDEKRYEWLKRFGIGGGAVVGFPGEENGWIRPASEWDNQTHYATTFGQAFTATIPQVVSAYQTIANGGVRVPLSLIESCTSPDGELTTMDPGEPERILSEDTAEDVRLMLENVGFQGPVAEQIKVPGYSIAAKTGTAQKTDGNGRYKSGIYFTSIVGFAPADDPQYVVMITLDEPKRVTSSAATAPALQKAMEYVLKDQRVLPGASEPETKLPKFK